MTARDSLDAHELKMLVLHTCLMNAIILCFINDFTSSPHMEQGNAGVLRHGSDVTA